MALTISIVSLAVASMSWWDSHNGMLYTNKPALGFYTEDDLSEPAVGIRLENGGPGVAYVQHLEYFIDGRDVGSDKNVPAAKLGGDEVQPVEFDPEDPIGAGDKEWVYFRKTQNRKQLQEFADFVDDHLAIEVRYCSVDGRCWNKCSTAGKCKRD
jgi:hypothetical protein